MAKDCLIIEGPQAVRGVVRVSGSKNASLPIMAATILASDVVRLESVPRLTDVTTLSRVLEDVGMRVHREATGTIAIETRDVDAHVASERYVRKMRASFCILGPLLAKRGRAVVPLPGGCRLGPRPVDIHLRALERLGAEITLTGGAIHARAKQLRGAKVDLLGPHGPSVTATANALCAAVLARGTSVLQHVAREPEIVDLTCFLQRLGARIEGAGTHRMIVDGVDQLGGGTHRVIPDRMEAATWLIAAAATGGEILLAETRPDHLTPVLAKLERAGCAIRVVGDLIQLQTSGPLSATSIVARCHPFFPTDVQPLWTALAAASRGRATIRDSVFPERFAHVAELARMGARLQRTQFGLGVDGATLSGATVRATDLRCGAALLIAGLCATGATRIENAGVLRRGYENLASKLGGLGIAVRREHVAHSPR